MRIFLAEYGYTTLFEPLSEGGFNVLVPAIPEICTYGQTLEEAREMARDAIRCFWKALSRPENQFQAMSLK
jgi:predicted RNase H-like HicB family nuclease